jgi:signal transduction histidine kinase
VNWTPPHDPCIDALQAIRRASKAGLRELRAILDVLRQVDGDSPAVPVPDLHAIQALIDATSAAGTPTTLRADGYSIPLPPQVALAAYRIVQESLTNVIRHAGRASATVTVRHAGGHLLVDIVNDSAAAPAPFRDGAGAGLTGMRERAAALGGTFEAGPRPGGGCRVHAKLPMTAPPSADQEPEAAPAGPDATGLTSEPSADQEPEAAPAGPGLTGLTSEPSAGQRVSRP